MGEEREEREEAIERTYKYYGKRMIDPPDHHSEEWKEMLYFQLEKIREGY